jgi:hypothetical protein
MRICKRDVFVVPYFIEYGKLQPAALPYFSASKNVVDVPKKCYFGAQKYQKMLPYGWTSVGVVLK